MKEWTRYRIPGTSSQERRDSAARLETISHVAHVEIARRILIDDEVRCRLIFDESILNRKRIQVVWLSPNYWYHGYRYGNIEFVLDWQTLLGRFPNYYWVEDVAYGIPACRILLTDIDRSGELQPYDPGAGDGPWWFDGQEHFWNNNYALEIMVEASVPLSDIEGIHFVDHHREWCSMHRYNPSACPELGFQSHEGGQRLLCRMIQAGADLSALKLKRNPGGGQRLHHSVEWAFTQIFAALAQADEIVFTGGVKADSDAAIPIARALLGALDTGSFLDLGPGAEDVKALGALFVSRQELLHSCARAAATMLDLSEGDLPSPFEFLAT